MSAGEVLINEHRWHPSTLDVWIRAHGNCEYCDENLLASGSSYFHGAHIDHLVPGAGDGIENLALACVACNRRKRRTDFTPHAGPGADRAALIGLARSYIRELRDRDEMRLQEHLGLLRECGLGAKTLQETRSR
jgi:HNH endonuclease